MAIILPIVLIGGYIVWQQSRSRKDDGTLIVGTAAGYAPWVSINERGEYEGFDIDVINAVAQKLNKKLVLKDLGSMTPLFLALEQGSIDAFIWGMSITQERLNKIAMVKYQGDEIPAYALLFWKEIPDTITCIEDMQGMTVCVECGSAQDSVLNKYPNVIKKYTEKVDDGLLNIQYGKADAVFVEPAIARKFMAAYPEIKKIEVPLSGEDTVYGIGICIRNNNSALTQAIEQAVESLRKEGIIRQLEARWNIS